MPLRPGSRLGTHEIIDLLGSGGMGEVYRARDTRLQRNVAVKVLPATFASDPDRRARFEREAQALAALSHPNVLAIFETGVHDAQVFVVSELLEGETLRARLEAGTLPIRKAIEIATQIARGLAAAHDKHIFHRDLKPENVFLLADGQVKILDFGLAKQVLPTTGAGETTAPITDAGTVMGTIGYMAPEQVRAQPADARTDLFALGVVLHEMLGGRRAFGGDTAADVAMAILRDEPPELTSLRPDIPAALDRIVRHCLEKQPAERFQSARDVAFALASLSGSAGSGGTATAHGGASGPPALGATHSVRAAEAAGPLRARRFPAWQVGAVSLIAGILLTMAVGRWAAPTPAGSTVPAETHAPIVRATIGLPASAPIALGSRVAAIGYDSPLVTFSPDGRFLTYTAKTEAGTILYLLELTSGSARALPGTEGAVYSFFSPDSQSIGFLTSDRVKKVSVQGGAVITLCEAFVPILGWWTATGKIYFTEEETFRLSRVAAEGGPPERILDNSMVGGVAFSDVLPDGQSALATALGGIGSDHLAVVQIDLRTRETRRLVPSGYGARYVPPGYLMFGRAGSLFAVRLDAARGTTDGNPVLVADGVAMDSLFRPVHATASANGMLAYLTGGDLSVGKPAWVDRKGSVEFLDVPPRVYGVFDLSPDGQRLALHVSDVRDSVWVYDLARGAGRRVASADAVGWPTWSPDGTELAVFTTDRPPVLHLISAEEGAPAPRSLTMPGVIGSPTTWSRAAKALGLSSFESAWFSVFVDPATLTITSRFDGAAPTFSPDGRWVAYEGGSGAGVGEVFIRSYPDGAVVRQISVNGGIEPHWNANGELLYRVGQRWWSTRVTTEASLSWNPNPPALVFDTEFIDTPGNSFKVSADGQRLLVVKAVEPRTVRTAINIVVNWPETLRR
ncbi:MAG: protein kinase domain-containing protein [Acidobacteriota bacterium]